MKKLIVVLLAICISAFARCASYKDFQVQVGVGRSGLKPCTIGLAFYARTKDGKFDAKGSAEVVVRESIDSGKQGSFDLRIPDGIDLVTVSSVSVSFKNTSQRGVDLNHIVVRTGKVGTGWLLVDERVRTSTQTGIATMYDLHPTSEGDTKVSLLTLNFTPTDTARDAKVTVWLELADGRVIDKDIYTRATQSTESTIELKEPVERRLVRQVKILSRKQSYVVWSRPGNGGASGALDTPDNVHLKDIQVTYTNSETGLQYFLWKESALRIDQYGTRESPLFTTLEGSQTSSFKPRYFYVIIDTGEDDLRWNPNQPPAMNFEVRMNIKGQGVYSALCYPRTASEKFAEDGYWTGTFESYGTAHREVYWHEDPENRARV